MRVQTGFLENTDSTHLLEGYASEDYSFLLLSETIIRRDFFQDA
jgi:hypothetical protein